MLSATQTTYVANYGCAHDQENWTLAIKMIKLSNTLMIKAVY